jgi:hypothetical protein
VGFAALDVLRIEPLVKSDGRVETLKRFVGLSLETATPGFLRNRCLLHSVCSSSQDSEAFGPRAMAKKIRNPNIETRNNIQRPKFECQKHEPASGWLSFWSLEHLDFKFVSDFEFRASDFTAFFLAMLLFLA